MKYLITREDIADHNVNANPDQIILEILQQKGAPIEGTFNKRIDFEKYTVYMSEEIEGYTFEFRELKKECSECEGGGIVPKLYPNGHTEERCEKCDGEGQIYE